jgi:signal transduction histidine kinase
VTIALRRTDAVQEGGTVEISVSDTGRGMAPAMLDQAARPFSQLSNTAARRYRGRGLGLALVRRKASMLGGNLELHSTPGHGAQFTVGFPVHATGAKAAIASMPRAKGKPAPMPLESPPSGKRVPRRMG